MVDINFILDRLDLKFKRRIPNIIQSESSECGLACIAMICRYYGMEIDLVNLRREFGISSQGATLQSLIEALINLNLKTRALSIDIDELNLMKKPCILHWNMNHFVVLIAIRNNKFIIQDPAIGKRTININEFSNSFSGVAMEVWPDSNFKKVKKISRLNIRTLLNNITNFPSSLLKVLCLSFLIEGLNIAFPIGTQLIMDHVVISSDYSLLTLVILGLFVFTLLNAALRFVRAWVSLFIDTLVNVQWKISFFDYLMKLPLDFFEKRKVGDIQSRLESLDSLRNTLINNIINGIVDGVMVIGLFIMMTLYGSKLVLIVMGFTLLYIALRVLMYNKYIRYAEEYIVKSAEANSHFTETIYGIASIKSLGLSLSRSKNWLNLNIEAINSNIKNTKLSMFFYGANSLISSIDHIIILWIGSLMVMDNLISLGMFVAFNIYRSQFSERAANLINMLLEIKMLTLHCDRVSDVIFTDTENYQPKNALILPNKSMDIRIDKISFKYDVHSMEIFSNLSFSVMAGESVAIVGPSGMGKTTLMKVMSGLLSPTSGNIYINDINVDTIGLNNYRDRIACVLQDDKLFSGTIAENISSFESVKDDKRIVECAILSNIHEEIMKMPMGYETMLSELGGSLSGGQKQRLMIARALYKQPSILFLDEATSHLDLKNEAYINQSISSLKITRIIIAHRESTIASVDRVLNPWEAIAKLERRSQRDVSKIND